MTINDQTAETAERANPPIEDISTIGRLNAWFFDAFDRYINAIARRPKRHAFDGIEAGTIVELGAGVGANFTYVPSGSRVVAIEPNRAMHARLLDRAAGRGVEVELVGASAEGIPMDDNSVDTVICSLVLCTIADPSAAVAEVRRILKPGGTFRFVEHVGAHPLSPRRWVQTAVSRPWAWLFEGCALCRDTAGLIERAGFAQVDIRRGRLRGSAFFPVNLVISGIATR